MTRRRCAGSLGAFPIVGCCELPGIGRRVYPLCRAFPRLAHDLEAEALVGLLQAVRGWRLGEDRVATRLVWAAARGAHRLLRRESALGDREASVGLRLEPPPRHL